MNIVNLFYRNTALVAVNNSPNKVCSEYTAFKNFHYNRLNDEILEIKLEKKANHSINGFFFVVAIFFAIVFLNSGTISKNITLLIVIVSLIISRYVKYTEWFLLVTFKKNKKAQYKMMNYEKKEALELIVKFKKKLSHAIE